MGGKIRKGSKDWKIGHVSFARTYVRQARNALEELGPANARGWAALEMLGAVAKILELELAHIEDGGEREHQRNEAREGRRVVGLDGSPVLIVGLPCGHRVELTSPVDIGSAECPVCKAGG